MLSHHVVGEVQRVRSPSILGDDRDAALQFRAASTGVKLKHAGSGKRVVRSRLTAADPECGTDPCA